MTRVLSIAVLVVLVATLANPAHAAGGAGPFLEANVNLSNKTSLQRGARLFVNYCLSCHSAKYMRYNRLAEDLELEPADVESSLMFTTDKIGDTMNIAMPAADAERWFGVPPPDLSVTARAKGADWLYSFLNGFYVDESRPTGVNNVQFPDTAMPHVLWELQGVNKLVEHTADEDDHDDGHAAHHGPEFEQVMPGTMSRSQYEQATRDLTAYLVYMAEPAQLVRYRIGFWVIAFLFALLLATYLMKREYWKDVH